MRRLERDQIRDLSAELVVITNLVTPEGRIEWLPLTLTSEAVRLRYRIGAGGALEAVAIPANERN